MDEFPTPPNTIEYSRGEREVGTCAEILVRQSAYGMLHTGLASRSDLRIWWTVDTPIYLFLPFSKSLFPSRVESAFIPYATTFFHHILLPLYLISILALALSVSASPLVGRQITSIEEITQIAGQNAGNSASNKGKVVGDFTTEQGVQTCGNSQLNCCNKVEKGDTTNAGLLGSVFGSGDLGVQCSLINVAAAIGAQVPINKACDAKAACCQGNTSQNGVVNVGCVALASLI